MPVYLLYNANVTGTLMVELLCVHQCLLKSNVPGGRF